MKTKQTRFFFLFMFLGATIWQLAGSAPAKANGTVLDSADYTFAYPDLPDPAVWSVSAQGSVTQVPVDGTGLALSDPDNSAMLLYVHPTPFLSGDPNNPNFQNTATFRIQAHIPYVSNGSLFWSGDAIGWRMIVDDGVHRLELALSRDAAFARQVRLQNTPSFSPVDFPWDNELLNTFEITRLEDGNYRITLTNADPSLPAVSREVLAGQLSPSNGTPLFAWGMDRLGGGATFWQEVHAEVRSPDAGNPPAGGTVIVVNAGPGDQIDPHLSGTSAAYTSVLAGNAEIRYQNLLTAADLAIPTGGGLDHQSDFDSSTIVYTHISSNSFAISAFDVGQAQPPAVLDPVSNSQREKPSIGGGTVAWMDFGLSSDPYLSEIVVYNRANGATTRLTNDLLYDIDPEVTPDGSTVVWTKCQSPQTGCTIWQAANNGGAWNIMQLPTTGERTNPAVDDRFVVYQGAGDNDKDIYWQLLGGSQEQRIALPGDQADPAISGGVVVFESKDPTAPSPNWDIKLYDLNSGVSFQVSDSDDNEKRPDVAIAEDGLVYVVWERHEADSNIYARTLRLPSGDTTPPIITINAPEATIYALNQVVPADYACADEEGGSGLASCEGLVSSGSAIDTATVGSKTFTVTALDGADNRASESVNYTVTYAVCPLYDQSKTHKLGSTVPIKLQLCDAAGTDVSAAGVAVRAASLTKLDSTATGDPADAGNANPDHGFRFDAALGGYIYNLGTRGLSTGTWALSFSVDGDPRPHSVQFGLR